MGNVIEKDEVKNRKPVRIFICVLLVCIAIVIFITYKPVTVSVGNVEADSNDNSKATYELIIHNKTKTDMLVYVEIDLYTITGRYIGTVNATTEVYGKQEKTSLHTAVADANYDLTYAKFEIKTVKYMETWHTI